MKTTSFKFETRSEPLHIPSARLSVSRWIRRRAYPIRIIEITERVVLVELQAPTNAHHNRAVRALGKILQRQLDHRHCVQSRLVPSYAVAFIEAASVADVIASIKEVKTP